VQREGKPSVFFPPFSFVCVSFTDVFAQPRALVLGSSLEGAVVERNRTYFMAEMASWEPFDIVRLTLSQGEATLVGAIGFVPTDGMFQFTPGNMMVGAVRELNLITKEPIINSVDLTLFVTVIGQQGSTVFTIELIGQREAVIIPGLSAAGGVAVIAVLGGVVCCAVVGFLLWYGTVGREKMAIWKAVREAKAVADKPSDIPDYVPSGGDIIAINANVTAAARQTMLQQQFVGAGGGGGGGGGSMSSAYEYGYEAAPMLTVQGARASVVGNMRGGTLGGDINPVW
jgi:hypothetical protein